MEAKHVTGMNERPQSKCTMEKGHGWVGVWQYGLR